MNKNTLIFGKLWLLSFLILSGCGASGEDTTYVPYTVSAGSDRIENEQVNVTLSGSVSQGSAPVRSMLWIQTSGAQVEILNENAVNSTFTLPTTTEVITLSFSFSVIDTEDNLVSDSMLITVHPVNETPLINSVNDAVVNEQTLVEVMSNAEDLDGSINEYIWEQLSGPLVELINGNSAKISFISPPVKYTTPIEFLLTVIDNEGGEASGPVRLLINPITELVVTFPGYGLYTAGAIAVAGRIDEYAGDYGAVVITITSGGTSQQVEVNSDGRWRIEDFLIGDDEGRKKITISANDGLGFVNTKIIELDVVADVSALSDHISVKEPLGHIYDFGYDNIKEKLFVNSAVFQNQENLKITEIDPITTSYVTSSSPAQGNVAMNSQNEKLLIVKPTYGGDVLAFNTLTRQSTTVLSEPLKADESFISPRGICLFENSSRAFIALTSEVLKIDLGSGAISTVSNSEKGMGDELGSIDSIACNEDSDTITILDSVTRNGGFNSLYEIDVVTGDRTLQFVFTGQIVSVNPDKIFFNRVSNTLLMTAQGTNRTIHQLDDLGQLTTVSSSTSNASSLIGRGPALSYSPSIAVDEINGRVFVESAADVLLMVDIKSGDRIAIFW